MVEIQGVDKESVKGRRKSSKGRYTITFDPRATALLKKYAEEEGVSMAEIIRRALNFYELKRMTDQPNRYIEIVETDESGKEVRRFRVLTRLV